MKKIVYVDMDDVIADFWNGAMDPVSKQVLERRMWDKNFFLNLAPIPGSQAALFEIGKMGFDIYILSQPLAECPESYTDKAKWIQLYFPQLYNKIVLTQNKGLHLGGYLIDDNAFKWQKKFEQNGGKFIHFPYGGYNYAKTWALCPDPEKSWRDIVEFFRKESKRLVG